MSDQKQTTLEYEAPRPGAQFDWPAYIVAIVTGVLFGYALSVSGYDWVCAGMLGAFVLSSITSLVARSHKILFGLLACTIVIATCEIPVEISNARRGTWIPAGELLRELVVLTLVVAGPGLVGSTIVALATRLASNKPLP